VYCCKEYFDAKEAELRYISTDEMWADGASKPLVTPKKFGDYRRVVQGDQLLLAYKSTGGH
jgi:hypothetical protein